MTKEYYKILPDNLGEYTVVDENNILIITELEHRIHAEVICEELNNVRNECEYWKSVALHEQELKSKHLPDTCPNYQPKEEFIDYKKLCEKYNVSSAHELDNMITSILNEKDRLNKTIRMQTMALCDFHNRELADSKWGDKRPEFNLDKYYEVCMEELKQVLYKSDVKDKLNNLILECENGIQETIGGEKDSYIVKHDIAIKLLKRLADELEVTL